MLQVDLSHLAHVPLRLRICPRLCSRPQDSHSNRTRSAYRSSSDTAWLPFVEMGLERSSLDPSIIPAPRSFTHLFFAIDPSQPTADNCDQLIHKEAVMRREGNAGTGLVVVALGLLLLVPVLYVLSIGPAVRMCNQKLLNESTAEVI